MLAAGGVLIVVGAAGALLPILPGWPFFFVGLSMVSPSAARRLKRRLFRRLFKQDTVFLGPWKPFRVRAGFTTKHFPLALKKTDELLDLSNQSRFKDLLWKADAALEPSLGSSERFVFLNQVHGDNVAVVGDEAAHDKPGFYHFLEADGVLTSLPRLTLLVMTADCLPIFLCAVGPGAGRRARQARWIGLVHAGWRGTEKGIARKAARMLIERLGCRPQDAYASFGPCIGARAYEVGPEFRELFHHRSLQRRGSKLFFDLAGENRRQLEEAGLKPWRIADPSICTVAENDHFYSYRKEKEAAGRMISFITRY